MRDRSSTANRNCSVRPIHAIPVVPLFLIALLASSPIRDNSFLWHIRAGAEQLRRGIVIVADPFSFTTLDEAWRTQSWLIELLYAYLEQWTSGLAWVNVMVFLLGAMTAGFVGLSMYRATESPVTTGFAMIATVWLGAPFLQPRPVLASYVLLAALVLVLQNRDRLIWLVVPMMWIWTAVHGSWVIGGGLLILEWLRTSDRRIFRAGVSALPATLLTAHGLGAWLIIADFAGARDALSLMQEWMVPDFGNIVQAPYLLLVVGLIGAGMRGRIEWRDLIVVLPFLFFGMTSRRAVFPAAIVVAPWAALAIPRLHVPRASMSKAFASGVLVLMVLVAVSPLALLPLGRLDDDRFPTPDVQEAIANRNVFHDAAVGGYLIYDEWPDRLVYIDDRAELFGADRLLEFDAARQGRYEDVFARYGFDAALTQTDWPLTSVLQADGWEPVVESESFTVLLRP